MPGSQKEQQRRLSADQLPRSLIDLNEHIKQAVAEKSLMDSCDSELDRLDSTAGRQLGSIDGTNATAYVRPDGAHEAIVSVHPGRGTRVQSSGEFCSAVLPVAHFTGKWAYELTMNGGDLSQIGWSIAPRHSGWSATHGTGDFAYTFGYDGFRKKVWNIKPKNGGASWCCGDIITCLLDLDQGEFRFLQNGRHVSATSIPCALKSAFPDDVPLAYFPSFTIGSFESCYVNYGEWPFRYVPDGFNPLHSTAPTVGTRTLWEWSLRFALLRDYVHTELQSAAASGATLKASVAAASLLHHITVSQTTCRALFDCLWDELDSEENVNGAISSNARAWLSKFVEVVYAACETNICHDLWCGVISRLCFMSRNHMLRTDTIISNSATAKDSPHQEGWEELRLLSALFELPIIRAAFGHSSGTFADLINLCCIKAPNKSDLEEMFPEVPSYTEDPTKPCDLTRRIANLCDGTIVPNDRLRMDVLSKMLQDTACRDHVYDFVDVCIRELRDRNRDRLRQTRRSYEVAISPQVVARVFYLLTCLVMHDVRGRPIQEVADIYMSPLKLANASIEKVDIQRLGGSYPGLHRFHPLDGNALDEQRLAKVEANPLLLKCTILYILGVKERVMSALSDAALRHKLQHTPDKKGRHANNTEDPNAAVLDEAQQKEYAHLLRCCALDQAVLFMTVEQDQYMKELCILLGRLLDLYKNRIIFRYIPVVVLECFVDALHYLRRTSSIYVDVLQEAPYVVTFFLEHFLENDKVTIETSEYISVTTTTLLDTNELYRQHVVATLRAQVAHENAISVKASHQQQFQKFLLRVTRQFDHRLAWTTITGILAHFNIGNAFCCDEIEDEPVDWDAIFVKRRDIRVPRPIEAEAFKFYHAQFRQYLTMTASTLPADELSTAGPNRFLQNLIDHANWSVSELGLALSEIKSQDHPHNQARRTASVFDLTVRLLHCVEFVVEVGYDHLFEHNPTSDVDSKNAIHTQMVADLAAQCLTRFGSPGAIERVAALKIRSLETLRATKVHAAINGILYSMTKGGALLDLEKNCFLACISRPSCEWTMDQVRYGFSFIDWASFDDKLTYLHVKKGSFTQREDVIAAFEAAFKANKRGGKLDDDDKGVVEEGLCSICAFAEINTSFDPCGHTSCGACIRRHMMNSTRCFFCNKEIKRLVHLPGSTSPGGSGGPSSGGAGGGSGVATSAAPQIQLE